MAHDIRYNDSKETIRGVKQSISCSLTLVFIKFL